ncbi:LD-carboxypeptidase [Psychrobacter sp. FDAARGOS_221]|uniref:LD-carboxypeptidase n=1 Tax=Psychrobacter sp. FDAARGOS_221 TaxID=1975705 RepID=UPI000BB598EE|nr:LD-carboxypeptidase [Psychrobacter sp. FDAARGOS_221]PNK61341.1 LD-carboxypeptidase [Psychrobacter sp. FDAARGOS_221]
MGNQKPDQNMINIKRRQLLTYTLLGASGANGLSAASAQNSSSFAINPNSAAFYPTVDTSTAVATRLFSCSNLVPDPSPNDSVIRRMAQAGFVIENGDIVPRRHLRFGGTDEQRANDLQQVANEQVATPKLLWAVRGGYGAMRLLESVDWQRLGQVMRERGTILAGFSDVTAIQCALLAQGGMSSLAAPMLYSEFNKPEPDQVSCQGFVDALTNPNLTIKLKDAAPVGSETSLSGVLWGGNLSVVAALAGTDYMPNPDGGIVFLEEVGEQPFRIERMLYSLYLSGVFNNQQAIVLGSFSNVGTDGYNSSYGLSEVIKQLQQMTKLPVYTGLPFGHTPNKHSFPLGAQCQLNATSEGVTLKFSGYPVIDSRRINAQALWETPL